MAVAWDTETTGMDFYHGTKPYFVTSCDEDLNVTYWGDDWEVDPLTRDVKFSPGDADGIAKAIMKRGKRGAATDVLVMHNQKFDVKALNTIIPGVGKKWPWGRTVDTLTAGHILESNLPHSLDEMAKRWLRYNMNPVEDRLEEACQAARRYARSKHPDWRIAAKGLEDMPSAKGKVWKADGWLPRELWKRDKEVRRRFPEWEHVLRDYANEDSPVTIRLWVALKKELERRGLMPLFEQEMKMVRVLYEIEDRGVTINRKRLNEQKEEYGEESARCERVCINIAKSYGYDLEIGKGITNSLKKFMFEILELPTVKETDSGNPSMDSEACDIWLLTLDDTSKPWKFVKNLADKRKRDTALTYMATYEKFAVPIAGLNIKEWFRIHPSLNGTGTRTTRLSSSNPNEQSISKKKGFNLRFSFGPIPGRKWYSCDAQNIELRLPAWKFGEQAMIDLFLKPNEPPYFGSNHLLVAHVLHKQRFEECKSCLTCRQEQRHPDTTPDTKTCSCKVPNLIIDGRVFKRRYEATWYKWIKNGNFAVQYGAVESSGTADRAYHVKGGQRMVQERFTKSAAGNERLVAEANKNGYIETVPRKSVNPKKGYPLRVNRSWGGKVEPTKPLNYYIQGTAGEWMKAAMVRCQEQLDAWRAADGFDGYIIMSVHDEMVFDFPEDAEDWRIARMRELMEDGGDDIGVPTPTSCELHLVSWSEGEAVNAA